MSARLTHAQAADADAYALREVELYEGRDGAWARTSKRILDLKDENAALHARAEQAERGDVAWLVEREIRPRWWTGRINAIGHKEWTDESLEAIRFARREDAEAMIRHLSIEHGAKATHHAWTDASGALTRATQAEGGAA